MICSPCAQIHSCGTSAFCGNGTSSHDGVAGWEDSGVSISQDGRTARLARVGTMIDPMSIKLFLKFRNCSSFSVSQLRGSLFVETCPCDKTYKNNPSVNLFWGQKATAKQPRRHTDTSKPLICKRFPWKQKCKKPGNKRGRIFFLIKSARKFSKRFSNPLKFDENPGLDFKMSSIVLPGVPRSSQGPSGCQSGATRHAE